MKDYGWKYYNRALIPNCAPDEIPNVEFIMDISNWKKIRGGTKALLSRFTTDFDCKKETEFWYCVKDQKFDISELNSKKRYEINKGNKNFEIKRINAEEYKNDLLEIQIKAFLAYPEKYRPKVNKEKFLEETKKWDKYNVYGAFEKEKNKLCGYALVSLQGKCYNFNVLKTIPDYEKKAINAAVVNGILQDINEKIEEGYYICDGSKTISHETHFQDYLEKYFNFRKAYCKLNIIYKPQIKIFIDILYPFRKLLLRFDNNGKIHNLNSLLKMEEIKRNCI